MQRSMSRVLIVILAGAVWAGAAAAAAQDPPVVPIPPPAVQDPPPPVVPDPPPAVQAAPVTTQPPVVPDPPVTTQPPVEPDLVMKPEQAARRIDPERRREQIIAMEGLLATAVRNAATAAARQMQALEPGLQYFTGIAVARGVYLEDYGVFFQVDIPGVSPTAQLRWMLDSMAGGRGAPDRERGIAQPARAGGAGSAAFDPDAAYVMAVQQKLMDAMLDYRIDLQPSEWLTVAARDGEGPAYPGQILDTPTMILRVRASDLADYLAGRITREEARERIEVREF
jgi:hypothetical protein